MLKLKAEKLSAIFNGVSKSVNETSEPLSCDVQFKKMLPRQYEEICQTEIIMALDKAIYLMTGILAAVIQF